MAFDQATRNRLQKFVSDARKLLSEEFTQQLQNTYGLDPVTGGIAELSELPTLSPSEQQTATLLRDTLEHYLAASHKADPHKNKAVVIATLDRIVREQAFTVLNRLAALRMAEARQFVMESISQGYQSKGFQLYQRIAGSSLGETGQAYQHYLFSVFDELSLDLAVLFDRYSSQGRLFPRETVLLELLDLINHAELEMLWAEDETVGWIYQYFNSKKERKKMRDESQAPRNSRELAVRNQFFTPRYVVKFLTENTLGRIWYEMTQGNTGLVDSCQYLVRRPNEIFLKAGEQAPEQGEQDTAELSQAELLQQTFHIQYRPIKDPRDIKMLDPACGSMHFGLYAFDLFEQIYSEAWDIEAEKGSEIFFSEEGAVPKDALHDAYLSKESFLADVPRLIIEHNIYGVDIDPRAAQIAGLSLWLRAQKSWSDNAIRPSQRPQIQRSNIVCAEPMPGETQLLKEFTSQVQPRVLGQLVEEIFEKMQLAGEAGTLLKIEAEIQIAIDEAKSQKDEKVLEIQGGLFGDNRWEVREGKRYYSFGDVGEDFWGQAEQLILTQLESYAEAATGSSSGQKRLFATDAAKGFAFIDLCSKRFDVVLMNPPFGEPTKKSKPYLKKNYGDYYIEIMADFFSRGFMLLENSGMVGALSSRTILINTTCEGLRDEVSNEYGRLDLCADLGYGVLDDAMVEAASYIVKKSTADYQGTVFFGMLNSQEKEVALYREIESLNGSSVGVNSYLKNILLFKEVFRFPWAYWLDDNLLNLMVRSKTIEGNGYRVRVGSSTADNFRYFRLSWEVSPREILTSREDSFFSRRWAAIAKGGEYWPLYDDIHLVSNWGCDGYEVKNFPGSTIRSQADYFSKGGTYPYRTTSALSCRVLPEGCLFADGGPAIIAQNALDTIVIISFLNTRVSRYFLEVFMGESDGSVSGGAARNYIPRAIGSIPFAEFSENDKRLIAGFFVPWLSSARFNSELDETSRIFDASHYFFSGSFNELAKYIFYSRLDMAVKAIDSAGEIEDKIVDVMSINNDGLNYISAAFGEIPNSYADDNVTNLSKTELSEIWDMPTASLVDTVSEKIGFKRFITKKSFYADRELELMSHLYCASPSSLVDRTKKHDILPDREKRLLAFRLVQLLIGHCFGRWADVKSIRSRKVTLENVFSPMLEFSPSFNASAKEGLSVICEFSNNKEKNLSSLISDKISSLLPGDQSNWETNILKYLDFDSIQKYVLNINSGFFDSHYSAYSKSRRQAPIYWPIQSSSGSLTIWIYYHDIHDETIFSIVNDIVDPFISELDSEIQKLLQLKKDTVISNNEMEILINIKGEVADFKSELLSIASWWKPNFNDGVQILAAPFFNLVRHAGWAEKLKGTWKEIEAGKYDWTSIAYLRWPERVLNKCIEDRSIAIAHNVEQDLWEQVVVQVGKSKKTKLFWQPKEMTETELDAYIEQKVAQG